jgi:hypothetical protein
MVIIGAKVRFNRAIYNTQSGDPEPEIWAEAPLLASMGAEGVVVEVDGGDPQCVVVEVTDPNPGWVSAHITDLDYR